MYEERAVNRTHEESSSGGSDDDGWGSKRFSNVAQSRRRESSGHRAPTAVSIDDDEEGGRQDVRIRWSVPKHRYDSRVYRFASDEAAFPDNDGEGSSGYDAGRNRTVRRGEYKEDSNARHEFGERHSGRSPRSSGLVFYESEFDAARRQPRVPSSALPSHNGFAKGGIAPINERYGVKDYLKPKTFDGTSSLDTFLAQFAICAEYNNWSTIDRAAQLKCCLMGQAGQLLWETGEPDKLSYEALVSKLKTRFGSTGQRERFLVELRTKRRKPGEALTTLHTDIRRLMAVAYPGAMGVGLSEELACDHFLSALNDELELKVREREPKDLDAALKIALRLEAYAKACEKTDGKDELGEFLSQTPARRRVTVVEKTNEPTAEWRRETTELKRKPKETTKLGHELEKEVGRLKLLNEQRQYTTLPAPRRQTRVSGQNQRDTAGVCFRCGEPGHFARECQRSVTVRNSSQDEKADTSVSRVNGASQPDGSGPKSETYLKLSVEGRVVSCLLDTGSEVTLLPVELTANIAVTPSTQKLIAANGTEINVLGSATIEATEGTHSFQITGLVSDHVLDPILGIDFLHAHDALWKFASAEIILEGFHHKLHPRGTGLWHSRVVTCNKITVPPRSESVVLAKVIFNDFSSSTDVTANTWVTEAARLDSGLLVSRVVLPNRAFDVPVRVMNTNAIGIQLEAGARLADLQPVDVLTIEHRVETPETDEIDTAAMEMVNRVADPVPEDCRQSLGNILRKYKAAFSFNDKDLGRTTLVRHTIETEGARPVRQPLRRHPVCHQDAIHDRIQTMLEQGIIAPSRSPWASNLVLVKKKDGSLRCCVDYRDLNAVTVKDAYPLPRTDVCFDALSGSQWFSTFDLRSSYHPVEMDPRDAEKTTFVCREGSFKFLTMPFGLCNAEATFQRLMDVTMSGLAYDICLTYIDDIIVFPRTLSEHLERLEAVLSRLVQAGLKLKPSKCHILQQSVEFLGHVVSSDGIGTSPSKTKIVADWPAPQSQRELRAFLRLASYYRRYVRNFAEVAAPLSEMTAKGKRFEWSPQAQEAFVRLKASLTSPPILAVPSDEASYVLDTDASDFAIGAVLSDIKDGAERVIAYASRKLSKQEINYCVTRRELLAVVFFVKHFRHYLLGRKFTIRTDHAALQWLRRIPSPVGQQARWLEQLEEFDFDVIHRAGRQHTNADALSRIPCDRPRCCPQHVNEEEEPTGVVSMVTEESDYDCWSRESTVREQTSDPDLIPIIHLLENRASQPSWDQISPFSETTKTLARQWERLSLIEGLLTRRFESADGLGSREQIVLPRGRRREFILMIHQGVNGGHLGRKRTERNVQARAY
jgi:hypothetical protein